MRKPPKHSIDPKAINVWKISATITMGILWIIFLIGLTLTYVYDWPFVYILIAALMNGILSYLLIFLFPKLRYRRWRYEVFDQEIYIQRGIFIMKRTLVPMIRVQHVDTEQGPIMRSFEVASISISTAATTHIIPALSEEKASDLRDRIAELARVDENDV